MRSIAETKLPDLNARDVDQAMLIIAGTARSMGVEVDSMSKDGKQYKAALASFDRRSSTRRSTAIRMLKEMQTAKFDETVEVHFNLGLNVRHADEQLRGTVSLPNGTGRDVRVAVFAQGDKAREARRPARTSSAPRTSRSGSEEGFTDFDVAVATPDMMGVVGRLGRILGPRGLMPNPKTGTVTMDVAQAVRDSKAGKLEYRTDRGANVHLAIGKKSFDEQGAARELRDASSTRSSARSRPPRRAATSSGSR